MVAVILKPSESRNMKTITTLEILNLAHSQLMQRLEKEEIFARTSKENIKIESKYLLLG